MQLLLLQNNLSFNFSFLKLINFVSTFCDVSKIIKLNEYVKINKNLK